mmetsp:Transcript_33496/g.77203  ORF Transcript_33496/g.77203 Transcript_33496/m.77203 type:complete len:233 (+) Transcript_33496:71-769(+)|eukprot:CAMPEP_0116855658 /NCGR_PEP_ID=MMETSP0418-20121206/19415_1 /TAXON_ID=1158023 /ORGANISM="Astrosyne radiata, Strain 13vi08-1A" /LENGTH=232 /DNA_ID=CAMNT_0004488845 /DNA_START=1 /DNA_END=699 /DNA_ORIENTATION=-
MSASSVAATIADHAGAVGNYFGSVRVPASFLAGASFAGLFTLKPDVTRRTKTDKALQFIYHLAITLCFLLSVNTIIISTAANTKSLYGGFDTMAESGYNLLNREFHYEFVSTRWSFLVSLMSFLIATTGRFVYEFRLFTPSFDEPKSVQIKRKVMGTAVCLLMSSLLLHLLAFINSTLFCWNNLLDMTIDLVKVIVKKGSWKKPLEPISIALAISGIGLLAYSILFNKEKDA